jgi:threonine dehydrogenase-like Zn-dependent dehydrogenase
VGGRVGHRFLAARISEITEDDTVADYRSRAYSICTLICTILKHPKRIIVCEKSEERRAFVKQHYPDVLLTTPEECPDFVMEHSDHGGADRVIEVAGGKDTFQLAWQCARPNAIVTIVALYVEPQTLPLPQMYGKNLTFKTGGGDGCDCKEILQLIKKQDRYTPLITHRYRLQG